MLLASRHGLRLGSTDLALVSWEDIAEMRLQSLIVADGRVIDGWDCHVDLSMMPGQLHFLPPSVAGVARAPRVSKSPVQCGGTRCRYSAAVHGHAAARHLTLIAHRTMR